MPALPAVVFNAGKLRQIELVPNAAARIRLINLPASANLPNLKYQLMGILLKAILSIITAITITAAGAQPPAPNAAQQAALALAKAKTDSATRVDYLRVLSTLSVKIPVLPPMADDPNRPKQTAQKNGAGSYYDAEGRVYSRSAWGQWTNYDDAKADNYTLPDPLKLNNGKPVTTANIWWQQRRPEIVKDYETSVFGRVPANAPKVTFEVGSVDSNAVGGTAIRKLITGHIDNSAYPVAKPVISVALYLPAHASGPVPLMVIASSGLNGGAATVRLLNGVGWAVAFFDTGSLQADNGAGLNQGIIGLVSRGAPRGSEDWGVLRAWTWGLSRAFDYFSADKAINPKQIGIEGHSRWGKTALLAAAMDTRWAIAFASCSGSMGASLEKRNYGENIDNVADQKEYHWMAGNFVKYGGNWQAIPVDAHDMMALIAPRPLFITGGTQDMWADPKGEFKACLAATPVYRLLGKTGIGVTELPAPDVSLIDGDLAFREHDGGHTDAPDWPVFLTFAKKYFR